MDHVRREDLTPGEIAVLDQNWAEVNDYLDMLITTRRLHRGHGCTEWYCGSEKDAEVIGSLELHQALQLLAGAVERLAIAGEAGGLPLAGAS